VSTTTSRLALYKPADDGSEPIDISTDINQNLDKIDAAIGFIPATSSTPPAVPFAGMARQDSDTGRAYYRNSANSSWVQIVNEGSTFNADVVMVSGKKLGIGRTPSTVIDVEHTSTGSLPAQWRVTGDTEPRVRLAWDRLEFGTGAATPAVEIYRAGTNELATPNDLTVAGELNVSGLTTLDDATVSGDLTAASITGDVTITGDLVVTGAGRYAVVYKTAVTNRANTTTFADDPTLTMALVANAVYMVKFRLHVGGDPSFGFKSQWTVPTGATGYNYNLGPQGSSTSRDNTAMRSGVHTFSTGTNYGMLNSTTLWTGITEEGIITTTDAGNVTLQWAQFSSGGTNTSLNEGSFLQVIRIA
jgi:hypothetical protein